MKLNKTDKRRFHITAWTSFIILALAQFLVQFHRNSPGVMKDQLCSAYQMNSTAFGTLSAMYFYPYMIAQIPMGVLLDVMGVRFTVAIGSFIAAIGSAIFGMAGSLPIACLGRILIGIGVSAPVVSTQKLVAAWFPESKVASVFSTSSVVAQCGALVAQYPLAVLIDHIPWKYVFFIGAAASIILGISCLLFVKNEPADIKLPSIAQLENRPEPPKSASSSGIILRSIKNTFANKYMWPVFIVMAIHQGLFTMFTSTWAIPYLKESFGYSTAQATGFTTGLMVASIFFSFIIGSVSDRLHSRKAVITGISAILLVLYVFFFFAASQGIPQWLLWTAMIIMGAGGCATQIMFNYSREVNDPQYVGISVSIVNVTGMLASSIMPTILGSLLDKYSVSFSGGELYAKAFFPCIIIAAVGLVFSFVIRDSGCKNRYMEWNS